jgi:hypothetical protein
VRPLGAGLRPDGQVHAIWAVGPKVKAANKLEEHEGAGTGKSAGVFDLGEGPATHGANAATSSPADSGGSSDGKLSNVILAHIFLMGIAWLLLAPLAIFLMRHLKRYEPVTFQAHRGFMSALLVVVLIAYILGAVQGRPSSGLMTAHLVFGTLVLGLAVGQVLMGALRPDKGAPTRARFNLFHWWGGRATVALALLSILLGIALADVSKGWYAFVALVVVAWAVLFAVFPLFTSKHAVPPSEAPLAESFWIEDGESSRHIDYVSEPARMQH